MILKNTDDIDAFIKTKFDRPKKVQISTPCSWDLIRLFSDLGFRYRRVGFRQWLIYPNPQFDENSNRIETRIIFWRLIVLLGTVGLLLIQFYSIPLNWIKAVVPGFEKTMTQYPVLSSILGGAILMLPFGLMKKKIKGYLWLYLGLKK